MTISRLDHVSVRTADVEGTRKFYEDILRLDVGPRPDFPFPGLWLYKDDRAVVHIVGIDKDDPSGLMEYLGGEVSVSTDTGSFDHVAFVCTDLEGSRRHFDACKIPYREREVPGLKLHQIFLTDPNGVTVELNYPETMS